MNYFIEIASEACAPFALSVSEPDFQSAHKTGSAFIYGMQAASSENACIVGITTRKMKGLPTFSFMQTELIYNHIHEEENNLPLVVVGGSDQGDDFI